jgi:hypothetical protein
MVENKKYALKANKTIIIASQYIDVIPQRA